MTEKSDRKPSLILPVAVALIVGLSLVVYLDWSAAPRRVAKGDVVSAPQAEDRIIPVTPEKVLACLRGNHPLLTLYVGAYYWLVFPVGWSGDPIPFYRCTAEARDAIRAFFAPMHWLDRRIRRHVWEPSSRNPHVWEPGEQSGGRAHFSDFNSN
jgi:hypothetical protein